MGSTNNESIVLSDNVLGFVLWSLALGILKIKNYEALFQEAYDRKLYNNAVIFNLHLWADYEMGKSLYHPRWMHWPDGSIERR